MVKSWVFCNLKCTFHKERCVYLNDIVMQWKFTLLTAGPVHWLFFFPLIFVVGFPCGQLRRNKYENGPSNIAGNQRSELLNANKRIYGFPLHHQGQRKALPTNPQTESESAFNPSSCRVKCLDIDDLAWRTSLPSSPDSGHVIIDHWCLWMCW